MKSSKSGTENLLTMIEVFSTNIRDPALAGQLLKQIHLAFKDYTANFDLDDCDRILRVQAKGQIDTEELIGFLELLGCAAKVLPDELPVAAGFR